MGPNTMPSVPATGHMTEAGDRHPGRLDGCQQCPPPAGGVRWVVGSSAEAEEQRTLSADYFVNRLPGESWTGFRVRRQIEELERRAKRHDLAATKLREQADQLRTHDEAPEVPE